MAEQSLTPSAKILADRIRQILAQGKEKKPGEKFHDDALKGALLAMTTQDMLELDPPGIEAGLWTNDYTFCRALGARLFGVSPESVDELPWTLNLFFRQIVAANFTACLAAEAP